MHGVTWSGPGARAQLTRASCTACTDSGRATRHNFETFFATSASFCFIVKSGAWVGRLPRKPAGELGENIVVGSMATRRTCRTPHHETRSRMTLWLGFFTGFFNWQQGSPTHLPHAAPRDQVADDGRVEAHAGDQRCGAHAGEFAPELGQQRQVRRTCTLAWMAGLCGMSGADPQCPGYR